jgi:hypothetical protein
MPVFFLGSNVGGQSKRSRRACELLSVACLLAVLAPSRVCSAEGTAEADMNAVRENRDEAQPNLTRHWYGWQTFSVDGVAAGFLVGAVAANGNTALYGCSAVSFVSGAPIVHLAHGQWGMALGSAGTRILAPLLGAVIGSQFDGTTHATSSGQSDGSSAKWTTTGVVIGGLVASAIDGLLLAYDAKPAPSSERARAQSFPIEALPTLVATDHSLMIGVSGGL